MSLNPSWQEGPKGEKIQNMFGRIAQKYDLANNILSAGVHHFWRRQLLKQIDWQPHLTLLDAATGTGDVALLAQKCAQNLAKIIAVDFCEEMLAEAKKKATIKDLKISFERADILNLPFPDDSFHRVTIAFGLRNAQDRKKALKELWRVILPGGKLGILEFGAPATKGFPHLFHKFYGKTLLPWLGGLITRDRDAYDYLETSSLAFPSGIQMVQILRNLLETHEVKIKSLTGGIAFIYVCEKPSRS